jgi:hypothetical protein
MILLSASGRAARLALGLSFLIAAFGGAALAGGGPGGGGGAPEIDAGSAMSALTLLSGGILLITDRIRRRKSSR